MQFVLVYGLGDSPLFVRSVDESNLQLITVALTFMQLLCKRGSLGRLLIQSAWRHLESKKHDCDLSTPNKKRTGNCLKCWHGGPMQHAKLTVHQRSSATTCNKHCKHKSTITWTRWRPRSRQWHPTDRGVVELRLYPESIVFLFCRFVVLLQMWALVLSQKELRMARA